MPTDPEKLIEWAMDVFDGNGNESSTFDRYCLFCERTTPHQLYAGHVSCTECGHPPRKP